MISLRTAIFAAVSMIVIPQVIPAATDAQLHKLGAVSVKEYGAKGDGVTDDTAKIQTAIDAATKAEQMLIFPEGVYLISAPLKCFRQMTIMAAGTRSRYAVQPKARVPSSN